MKQAEQLKDRTKQFAVRIVNLFRSLPKTEEARAIGKQVLRSGTGVGANYRAVCRARSKPEFIAKLGLVLEEAGETALWLELLIESGIVRRSRLELLLKEANELASIFVVSRHTARSGRTNPQAH